jgi:hypothetical protein
MNTGNPPIIPTVKSPHANNMVPRSPHMIPSPNNPSYRQFPPPPTPPPSSHYVPPSPPTHRPPSPPHFTTTSQLMSPNHRRLSSTGNLPSGGSLYFRGSATDQYAGNALAREGSYEIDERSKLRERIVELEAEVSIGADILKRFQVRSNNDTSEKFELNNEISRLKQDVLNLNNQILRGHEKTLRFDEVSQKLKLMEREKEVNTKTISELISNLEKSNLEADNNKHVKECLEKSLVEASKLKEEKGNYYKTILSLEQKSNALQEENNHLKVGHASEMLDMKAQLRRCEQQVELLKGMETSQLEELFELRNSNRQLQLEVKQLQLCLKKIRYNKLYQIVKLIAHKKKSNAFHALYLFAHVRHHRLTLGNEIQDYSRRYKILFQLWFKICIREKIRKKWLKWVHTDIHMKNKLNITKTEEILVENHSKIQSFHQDNHKSSIKEMSLQYDKDIQILYNKINEYRANELSLRHQIASTVSSMQDMKEEVKIAKEECEAATQYAKKCHDDKIVFGNEAKKLNIVLNQTLLKIKDWGLDPKLLMQENIVTDLIVSSGGGNSDRPSPQQLSYQLQDEQVKYQQRRHHENQLHRQHRHQQQQSNKKSEEERIPIISSSKSTLHKKKVVFSFSHENESQNSNSTVSLLRSDDKNHHHRHHHHNQEEVSVHCDKSTCVVVEEEMKKKKFTPRPPASPMKREAGVQQIVHF